MPMFNERNQQPLLVSALFRAPQSSVQLFAVLLSVVALAIAGCGSGAGPITTPSNHETGASADHSTTLPAMENEPSNSGHENLEEFAIDAAPRSGVRIEIRLDKLSTSASVSVKVVVNNESRTPYPVTERDFGLYVEGHAGPLQATATPHMPNSALPGELTVFNGFGILLPEPSSTIVGLTYVSHDPESQGKKYSVGSTAP